MLATGSLWPVAEGVRIEAGNNSVCEPQSLHLRQWRRRPRLFRIARCYTTGHARTLSRMLVYSRVLADISLDTQPRRRATASRSVP